MATTYEVLFLTFSLQHVENDDMQIMFKNHRCKHMLKRLDQVGGSVS